MTGEKNEAGEKRSVYGARSGDGDHWVIDFIPPLSESGLEVAHRVLRDVTDLLWTGDVWQSEELTRISRNRFFHGEALFEDALIILGAALGIKNIALVDVNFVAPIDEIDPVSGGIKPYFDAFIEPR